MQKLECDGLRALRKCKVKKNYVPMPELMPFKRAKKSATVYYLKQKLNVAEIAGTTRYNITYLQLKFIKHITPFFKS